MWRSSAGAPLLFAVSALALASCRTASNGPDAKELGAQWNIARNGFKPSPVAFKFVRGTVGMVPIYDRFDVSGGPIYLYKGSIDAEAVSGRRLCEFLRATCAPLPEGVVADGSPAVVSFGLAAAYASWAGKEVVTDDSLSKALSAALPAWAKRPAWAADREHPEWCLYSGYSLEHSVPAYAFLDPKEGLRFRSPGPRATEGSMPGEPRAAFRCWTRECPPVESWPPPSEELASLGQSDPSCPSSSTVVK